MLRGLLHEIVRRRLWPIPVVALLVAVAAPLLFLKSPENASVSAQGAPAVAAGSADSLPVRARKLLRTTPAAKDEGKAGKAADPFESPSSAGAANSATAAESKRVDGTGSSGSSAGKQEPVPVVITDADGKATTTTAGDQPSSNGSDSGYVGVGVRFAPTASTPVRASLPRLTPLTAKGRIVATFVKYSPSRNKAVFAISPNTHVAGSVKCRREAGLCRYVDLSGGEHVTLTILGRGGSLLTRRLSVARLRSVSGAEPRPALEGRCLLRKLLKLRAGDPAVLSGACD